MRTFMHSGDERHRFWNIEVSGARLTIHSGAVGQRGRRREMVLANEAEARTTAERQIARKLREGFRETTAALSPRTEREALEDALAESPNDRAALSAYADLLGEQGDPLGEFVRVQLALEDQSRGPAERKKLKAREAALLSAHGREWVGELADLVFGDWPALQFRMSRGWLEALAVEYLTADLARAIARAPQMRRVRELAIHGIDWGSEGRERPLPHLAACPFLGNVRVFRMGQDAVEGTEEMEFSLNNGYPAPEVPALVAQMPHLEELHLWVTGYDMAALFSLPTLSKLRVLRVYHRDDRHPLEALAGNPALGKLTHLLIQTANLRFDDDTETVGVNEALALGRSPHLKSLTHLQLRMTRLGDDGLRALVETGLVERLEVLDLRFGTITDAGARFLAGRGVKKGLRLNLSGNALTAAGVEALRRAGADVQAEWLWSGEHFYFEPSFE